MILTYLIYTGCYLAIGFTIALVVTRNVREKGKLVFDTPGCIIANTVIWPIWAVLGIIVGIIVGIGDVVQILAEPMLSTLQDYIDRCEHKEQ
jgi:uncharacterized membrane protein